jgi:hypothetical protein
MTEPARLSQRQLAERLQQAHHIVEAGALYMHYKQKSYRVVDIAINEADNEPCVIYKAEYGEQITFVRPVANWVESVTVDGKEMPRFLKVAQ